MLDFSFQTALNINCHSNYLHKILAENYSSTIIDTDISISENLDYPENSMDLVICCFGIHWINDLPNFLTQINKILKPEGIFIANFAGANSLKNLRYKLTELESTLNYSHSPHISPFIQFHDTAPLLQHAGFKEIIADFEIIELEYQTPLSLMKAIKDIGESNNLQKAVNYALSKKMLKMLELEPAPFHDKVTLISLIASKSKNSFKIRQEDEAYHCEKESVT